VAVVTKAAAAKFAPKRYPGSISVIFFDIVSVIAGGGCL
jgi:hypothetical protein